MTAQSPRKEDRRQGASTGEPSPTPASPGDDTGTITLATGTTILFRPIRPGDSGALQAFHRTLSEQSIYLRFFGYLRELTAERARYFTHLDGIDRFALVALDPAQPDTIIAVVRFDRENDTDRAEYAAVVADRWQRHGLGLALTWRLIAAARRRGIGRFFALVLPENAPMLHLFVDLRLPERRIWDDGNLCVEIALPEALSPDV